MSKSKKVTPQPAHTLPETVYVYEEFEDGEPFLVAGHSINDLADPQKRVVGTYRLVEVGTLQQQPAYEKTSY